MLIDTIVLYILILIIRLIDPELESRSQECEKAKHSAPIISQSFEINLNGICYTVETFGVMNFVLI